MRLRPAVRDDAEECAAVHVRCWQQSYAELAPGVLDLAPDARLPVWERILAEGAATLLVDDAGRVAGFVSTSEGELRGLYLLAEHHGSGWGRRLHDIGLERLHRLGSTVAHLWVLEANARARAFYERHGWEPTGERQDVPLAGALLPEVRYRRELTG